MRHVPGAITPVDPTLSERAVLMCASALFAGLDVSDCLRIASCARARTFARDEVLFMQGQPARSLMLLQDGSIKQTQIGSSGEEVILWMNGRGEAVGASSGEQTCSHTCSARALEKCMTLVWEYSRLQQYLTEYPQIRRNLNQILSNRIQELEERFREVATEKVAKRLALTLLRLIRPVGKQRQLGIELSLSREELAQMTGTTLFTISRILSKWGEEGFVLPRREAVVVTDVDRLREVVEQEQ